MKSAAEKPARLRIFGCYPDTAAYPNVHYRVRALREAYADALIVDHVPGWQDSALSGQSRAGKWRNLVQLLLAHMRIFFRVVLAPAVPVNYIPYPAVGLAWMLSWFGKRVVGERLVIDAFISLYDTVVIDRQLLKVGGLPARLLFRFERRAFHYADAVVVDTDENAAYLASLFDLPESKFSTCPLHTDEEHLHAQPPRDVPGQVRVIFVGTLVPLHGISTVVQAARILAGDERIHFSIVGDGQDNGPLQDIPGNLDWHRDWLDERALARLIKEADICLGIFGTNAKTQRVIPYKIYAYSRVGRPIITAQSPALETMARGCTPYCLKQIPPGSAEALAQAIRELADDAELLSRYAEGAKGFYQERLSNELAMRGLIDILREAIP